MRRILNPDRSTISAIARCFRAVAASGLSVLVLLTCLFCPASALSADKWGSLIGQFVLRGELPVQDRIEFRPGPECGPCQIEDESLIIHPTNAGIGNIVVYLQSEVAEIHPDLLKRKGADALLDIRRCRFEPHIAPLWIEQTLKITNSDETIHNASSGGFRAPFNVLLQPKAQLAVTFRRAATFPQLVESDLHPWMRSYVLPIASPYYAVSAPDGTFAIDRLPAGEHAFLVWHEKAGYLVARPEWKKKPRRGMVSVTIEGDRAVDLGVIRVDAALLAK